MRGAPVRRARVGGFAVNDSTDQILFGENDAATADLARTAMSRERRVVRSVRRVDEALRLLSSERFSLAILEHRLEDGDAWPILEAALALDPRVPVIVVSAEGDDAVAAEAIQRGASAYLVKSAKFWERLPTIVERVARDAAVGHQNALLASVVK
ncbi:MAG: response regulator [Acidobacteria bacterium]|nr:response regulator [Acidobacteriota bacterium]